MTTELINKAKALNVEFEEIKILFYGKISQSFPVNNFSYIFLKNDF